MSLEVAVPSAPVVRVQESAGLATLVTLKAAPGAGVVTALTLMMRIRPHKIADCAAGVAWREVKPISLLEHRQRCKHTIVMQSHTWDKGAIAGGNADPGRSQRCSG